MTTTGTDGADDGSDDGVGGIPLSREMACVMLLLTVLVW